ncbi:MAG: hypothetical protein ACR2HV_02875 [Acidimicrobiales bacterium]
MRDEDHPEHHAQGRQPIEGPGASFTTLSYNLVTQSGREGVAVLNTFNRFTPPS